MEKIKVGILGATGMVGQIYVNRLSNHPDFEITYLAASPESAGKTYEIAVRDKWTLDSDMPESVRNLVVGDANKIDDTIGKCQILFSACEFDKGKTRLMENIYATLGFLVISNDSAHRWTEDIPMIIPEVNHSHLRIIDEQRKKHTGNGFIVVKPNCSLQSYLTPIYALNKAGYEVDRLIVKTMQATSGAGLKLPALRMIDNVETHIEGENEKSENEPLKILGTIENGRIVNYSGMRISAQCNRVNVTHGHTALCSAGFRDKAPRLEEIIDIWNNFRSLPQELQLHSAPENPLIYTSEKGRPQPRKDRNNGNGMSITLGNLRKDNVLDIQFVGLSHNTIRGAAGGAILIAALLKARGYLDNLN